MGAVEAAPAAGFIGQMRENGAGRGACVHRVEAAKRDAARYGPGPSTPPITTFERPIGTTRLTVSPKIATS